MMNNALLLYHHKQKIVHLEKKIFLQYTLFLGDF